jgi:hypothetical protein
MQKGLTRGSIHSITEVFEWIDATPYSKVDFHGCSVFMKCKRLKNFRLNGVVCVNCGIRATFFAVESFKGKDHHLNLYAVTRKGELLMTRDHIKPSSKGGSNNLSNHQPMCEECNRTKSGEWNFKDRLRWLRNKIRYFRSEFFGQKWSKRYASRPLW